MYLCIGNRYTILVGRYTFISTKRNLNGQRRLNAQLSRTKRLVIKIFFLIRIICILMIFARKKGMCTFGGNELFSHLK